MFIMCSSRAVNRTVSNRVSTARIVNNMVVSISKQVSKVVIK